MHNCSERSRSADNYKRASASGKTTHDKTSGTHHGLPAAAGPQATPVQRPQPECERSVRRDLRLGLRKGQTVELAFAISLGVVTKLHRRTAVVAHISRGGTGLMMEGHGG